MLTLQLAFRNLFRNRRRTALSLLAIAVGAAALIVNGGIIYDIFGALREDAIRGRHGHLQIAREGYAAEHEREPWRYALRGGEADSLAAELGAMAEIEAVTPRVDFSGLIQVGERSVSFLGEGVVPRDEARFSTQIKVIDGAVLPGDGPPAVLLGRGLAGKLGVGAGDDAVLLTQTVDGAFNALDVRVAGVFEGGNKAYDDWVLKVPLPVAQELLDWQSVHRLVVLLDQTPATERVAARLGSAFSSRRLELRTWKSLALFHNQVVALFRRELDVIKVIIATVVVLSIANTMSMSVLERTREIGTVMAMGATPGRVVREFLLEGGLLGLLGGLAGVVLGVVVAAIITQVGITFPSPPGATRPYVGGCEVVPSVVAFALGLAVVSAALAALYAARRVSRLEVVEALREG
jgi:putative ABC transport system permease protein